MLTTVVVLSVVALAQSRDIQVGSTIDGTKIFDEIRQASPAIWKQTELITINTTDDQVISRINITDLRPDKDGEAKIVEGGEGQKNVTIELKSPTVLRGFSFQVEVFAVPDDGQQKNVQKEVTSDPGQVRKQRNPEDITKTSQPVDATSDKNVPISNDTAINDQTKTISVDDSESEEDDQVSTVADQQTTPASVTPQSEVSTNDYTRQVRDVTTETTQSGSQQTSSEGIKDVKTGLSTVRPQHDNGYFIHPGIDNSNYTLSGQTKDLAQIHEEKINAGDESASTTEKSVTEDSKNPPRTNIPLTRLHQNPVPYPIERTVPSSTENAQNKREPGQMSATILRVR